jgi:DUF971 family protein
MASEPVRIELQRSLQCLLVDWDDGHSGSYAFSYLRAFCPCAHCQGHAQSTWTFIANDGPAIARLEAVGNYALGVHFADGHGTGIYSFDILRELCPCAACRTRPQHPVYVCTSSQEAAKAAGWQ